MTAAGYVRNPRRRRAGLAWPGSLALHVLLAQGLDCDPRTIRRAAKERKIPAFHINEGFRFDPAAVRRP